MHCGCVLIDLVHDANLVVAFFDIRLVDAYRAHP
jgi:hypothetical protein